MDQENFYKNSNDKQEKTLAEQDWETVKEFIQRDPTFRRIHKNDKDYLEIKKICREKDDKKIELLLDSIRLEKFNFKSDKNFNEIYDQLMMGKTKYKTLSEVILMNSNCYEKSIEYEARYSRGTHRLEKPDKLDDYKLVLYNMDAINGIHPITDKKLFEENNCNKDNEICSKINFSNKVSDMKKNFLELGYCNVDDIYYYYKIMNGLAGYIYIVFFYSYKTSSGN